MLDTFFIIHIYASAPYHQWHITAAAEGKNAAAAALLADGRVGAW